MAETRADNDSDREHRLLAAVRRDDVQAVARLLPEKMRAAGGAGGAARGLLLPTTSRDGATLLHLARSPAMVDALFAHGGPTVRALVDAGCGRYPWKVPLCSAGSAGVARALLRHGASPDGARSACSSSAAARPGAGAGAGVGVTPLMEAAGRLDPESVAALLEAGANPMLVNAFGNSAADRAFVSRQFAEAASGGGGGGLSPSGVWMSAAGAAAGGGQAGAPPPPPPPPQQQQQQAEQDDEGDEDDENDADEDGNGNTLPLTAEEARARFARTLVLLLRAGGKMRPGYLAEALPVVARGLADAERAAAEELARRRSDPRLAAMAREDLCGLADDYAGLRRAEAATEASRRRLEELEAPGAGGTAGNEGDDDDGDQDDGGGSGGSGARG